MFICQGLRSCENSFMRYHALACDYDGTIARDGEVRENTILALEEVRKSGRKLILVTGRELDDLIKVFPRIDLFDRVVAENGAFYTARQLAKNVCWLNGRRMNSGKS